MVVQGLGAQVLDGRDVFGETEAVEGLEGGVGGDGFEEFLGSEVDEDCVLLYFVAVDGQELDALFLGFLHIVINEILPISNTLNQLCPFDNPFIR